MSDLPESALGVMRLMPSRVDEVAKFVKQIVSAVKSGDANALEVKVMMRALRAVAEEVEEEIDENAIREADKYSEKVIEMYGAQIHKSEVGVSYDYSSSGFTEWEQWDAVVRNATDTRKEKEAFLRALKEPITTLNENTGEIETIKPPQKKSKTGIKIYLSSKK